MNEEQLETFLAVAETRSFSDAASRLFISQPTVTHRINMLEADLGVMLFDRNRRTVRLTAEGQLLLPLAQKTMETMNLMYALCRQPVVQQNIIIGFPDMMLIGERQAFKALMKQIDQLPEIHTELRPLDHAPKHCHQLLNGDVDIILTDIDLPQLQTPDVNVHEMFTSKSYICMSADHPLAQNEVITFEMLKGSSFIWYEDRTAFSEKIRAILAQHQINDFHMTMRPKQQILQVVGSSTMLTVSNMIDEDTENVSFIPLDIPVMRIGIAWLKKQETPCLQSVISSILSIPITVWRR